MKSKLKTNILNLGLVGLIVGFVALGAIVIWIATLKLPDF